MLSVQQQLAIRAKRLRIDCLKRQRETSDRTLLSKVFSQWKEYKRFYEPIFVIQRLFMRSIWYIIKMRILKKKRQMIDETTCPSHQLGEFLRRKHNRLEVISQSRDFKNNNWTRLRVFLLGFVRTHSPVIDEGKFILKLLKMLLSQEEIDYIHKIMENQTFVQFFESTRKTLDKDQAYISDLLWILYYLSSERLPKSWFPNPESDFAFVFEKLKSVLGRKIQEETEEAEEAEAEPYLAGQPEQQAYCSQCGRETIQGMCFDAECMRRRENACPACGNPILEGSNADVIDGMRLHQDCANHNQHNPHFRNYTEYFGCDCSSNDKTFVEGFGFFCDRCIIANQ